MPASVSVQKKTELNSLIEECAVFALPFLMESIGLPRAQAGLNLTRLYFAMARYELKQDFMNIGEFAVQLRRGGSASGTESS